MSRSAFSLKIFAGYLLGLGVVLVLAPNLLLTTFGFPATSEVWIRVLGFVVVNLSVYYWYAAKSDSKPLFLATVFTRVFILVAFGALAVFGLAKPMLVLFGAIDAIGGLWTYLSLRRDETTA
ncbi:MAG TPA: hypothetical protein VLR50_11725 [Desulfobacterales bacterium]|nr:hypothetical protein [Desulfobacterales bacterium]